MTRLATVLRYRMTSIDYKNGQTDMWNLYFKMIGIIKRTFTFSDGEISNNLELQSPSSTSPGAW